MKKIKSLLMVFCALLCTTNLFASPDERVLELEKDFFYNGDFVKVYNSAIEMEEYAELMDAWGGKWLRKWVPMYLLSK